MPLADTKSVAAMQYARRRLSPRLRPNDPYLGRAASRTTAARCSWLAGIPATAETIALATILALVRVTGVQVHMCRLSCAESVALVRAAKKEGLPVTCDVAIHHLHLSDIDIGWFASDANLVPPLRTTSDRAALRAGVADGTIDLVCSDHAPVDDDGKPCRSARRTGNRPELLLPLLKWAAEDACRCHQWRVTRARKLIGQGAGDLGRAGASVCLFRGV